MALGVGCGNDTDSVRNNKGRKPFLDGSDFGECNDQLFEYKRWHFPGKEPFTTELISLAEICKWDRNRSYSDIAWISNMTTDMGRQLIHIL